MNAIAPKMPKFLSLSGLIPHHLEPSHRKEALTFNQIPIPPSIVGTPENQLKTLFRTLQLIHLATDHPLISHDIKMCSKLFGKQSHDFKSVVTDRIKHAGKGSCVRSKNNSIALSFTIDASTGDDICQIVGGKQGNGLSIQPNCSPLAGLLKLISETTANG